MVRRIQIYPGRGGCWNFPLYAGDALVGHGVRCTDRNGNNWEHVGRGDGVLRLREPDLLVARIIRLGSIDPAQWRLVNVDTARADAFMSADAEQERGGRGRWPAEL